VILRMSGFDGLTITLVETVMEEESGALEVEDAGAESSDSPAEAGLEKLFAELVSSSGLQPVWKVMCPHSAYLSSFLKIHYTLLRGDGPLPAPIRHLIAILASARFSCTFLIEAHTAQLVQAGGQQEWIDQGLAAAPIKIQKLYELNKILAHRPWSLTANHIEELTKPGQDNWSLSELVYAIVLMVHFHAFSSFVQCCVLMESDEAPADDAGSDGSSGPPYDCTTQRRSSLSPQLDKVEELLQRMETLKGKQTALPPKEELTVRFRTVELSSVSPETLTVPLQPDISQFVKDIDFQYIDFAKRGRESEFPTFRINDFNWDEQGYSMISRFYDDVAQLLDDKFRTIYNLTYGTMGRHSSIDTSLFRRASWNYIQCLWGIRHDDYDYAEVNELLHRNLKKYIKTASCYPELCERRDYRTIMNDFHESEKVHLLMLVGEAKVQTALLYSMRAVQAHFNNRS